MENEKSKYLEGLHRRKARLLEIINSGGTCRGDCRTCPLTSSAQRGDGSWFSCVAVVAELTGTQDGLDDSHWLEAATRILLDLEIEEMLLDGTGKEDPS